MKGEIIMDIEALFSHEAFRQFDAEQMQLFRQFARDIQGKSAPEVARLYMQVSQRASQIKPITPAQRNSIIEALRSFLPEAERQKLNGLLRMLR